MSDDGPQDCMITIYHGEDWDDSFFLMDGTRPLDLTGKTLELYIRPAFDHSTLIRKLTSAGPGEIIIDTPTKGAAHVFVTKANVASGIAVGRFDQFLRVVDMGGSYVEYWRGPMIVKPGRDTL